MTLVNYLASSVMIVILFDILLILLLSDCATQKLVAFTKYIQFEI